VKGFLIAFNTELFKTLKSKMLWATVIFFAFIAIMLGFLMLVAKHPEIAGESEVLSLKASMISNPNWTTYFWLLMQMVLTVGSIGPAIVTIWVFGREYSDRVIKDILVLPVSRFSIVFAKFIIVFIWSFVLLLLLYAFGSITGLLIHLDGWDHELFIKKTQAYFASASLTIILFPVITFITCISRGYLLPVGFAILILIATQFVFLGLPGITPYFPWAIPGLYSGVAGPLSPQPNAISYIILVMTSLLGITGTAAWWRYADHH
jgi:ABC-2 type transport system permease protein